LDTYGIANGIVQAWKPLPEGILNEPKVKFDITRRMDLVRFDKTDGAFTSTHQWEMPTKFDAINDDHPGSGEDEAGPFGGLLFVFDAPGRGDAPEAPITEMAHRYNFEEFLRVRVNGERPLEAEGVLDGSRASDKFLWHSRDQVKKVDGAWTRVAGYDEIGVDNDYTTNPT
jgi:hypothetical protein